MPKLEEFSVGDLVEIENGDHFTVVCIHKDEESLFLNRSHGYYCDEHKGHWVCTTNKSKNDEVGTGEPGSEALLKIVKKARPKMEITGEEIKKLVSEGWRLAKPEERMAYFTNGRAYYRAGFDLATGVVGPAIKVNLDEFERLVPGTITKPLEEFTKKTLMHTEGSRINPTEFYRNEQLTDDDRLLKEYGLEDPTGVPTGEGIRLMETILWAKTRAEAVEVLKKMESAKKKAKKE